MGKLRVQKPEQQYAGMVTYLARLCNFQLDESSVEIQESFLSDIPLERRISAIQKIITTRKANDRFPSIRDIREAAGEKIEDGRDDRFAATEISHSIWNAIGRFGYVDPDGAKAYLGQIAWAVVVCTGGWGEVCEATEFDKTTLLAQWRDIAMNMILKKRQGIPLEQIPGSSPNESKLVESALDKARDEYRDRRSRSQIAPESQNPAQKSPF